MTDVANNPRKLEVNRAQDNPTIISNLSGASNQQGSDLSALRNVVPQGAVNAAQGLSNELYGSGFVSGGDAQKETQMQELFRLDQAMEKNYNPLPTPSWYVPNPADQSSLYASLGSQAASNVGASTGAIDTTERAYDTAVGNLIDRFIDFYQMKQDEEDKRKDREYQEKLDRFETELSLAKLTGGAVTNPWTGERVSVPKDAAAGGGTYTEREFNRVAESVKADVESGVPIEDLIRRYGDQISYADIRRIYDQGSPYGSAQKGDEFYRGIYNQVEKSTGATVGNVLEALGTGGERQSAADYTSAIRDMSALLKKQASFGVPEGVAGKLTGPVAKLFGGVLPDEERAAYREDLNTFKENIRKNLYGTAFTAAEQKVSVLPGSGKQEGQNRRRLESMMARKEKELLSLLEANGIPTAAANVYIDTLKTGDVSQSVQDVGVVQNQLQGEGFSEDQINEYLQMKGLL